MILGHKVLAVTTVLLLSLGVAGCSGVRKQLGLNRSAPDEFRVVSRAPLTVPPEFSLRPPQPGAPRPQVGTTRDQARRAVVGSDGRAITGLTASGQTVQRTAGETSLLKQAGSDKSAPDIRFLVDSESNRINEESEDFLRKLIFWQKKDPPGVVVDANAETKRLQENATLGRTVTAGESPTIKREGKALFEDIF